MSNSGQEFRFTLRFSFPICSEEGLDINKVLFSDRVSVLWGAVKNLEPSAWLWIPWSFLWLLALQEFRSTVRRKDKSVQAISSIPNVPEPPLRKEKEMGMAFWHANQQTVLLGGGRDNTGKEKGRIPQLDFISDRRPCSVYKAGLRQLL